MHGDTVRALADAKDRQQYDLFELAEHGFYLIDNVENMGEHTFTQACWGETKTA